MYKKKIFIGSSVEELAIAEKVKNILTEKFDVTIWNETIWEKSVFKLNQNFLSDLLKASLLYDFGIFIGTTDDKVIIRGREVMKPRDNILFELGLFLGRMGEDKCVFLIDKDIEILSDFKGRTLARFDKKNPDSLENEVNKIQNLFLNSSETELNFFPSTTLASVYFENFIFPTCRIMLENDGLKFEGVKYKKCKIKILVPGYIGQDVNLQFQHIKCNFETSNIVIPCAGRTRNIVVNTKIVHNTLEIIDFPTIITGINHAISNIMPHEFNKNRPEYQSTLNRELARFICTLEVLISRQGWEKIVQIVKC